VNVLGLIGNPRALDFVRKGLGGTDPDGRAAALEALETFGDRPLKREVLSLLEEEPASCSLGTTLEALLQDNNLWNRALAVRATQELRLDGLIPRLKELKSDPDPLVSETAREALDHFDEEQAMNTLQTLSTLERVLLLREVPIFADLSPEDLQQIAEIAHEQWYPKGSPVCHQGDEGDMLYIIADGHLDVIHSGDGKEQVLAERGPGDFVGEMAIIEAAPRSATILTQDDARLLALEGGAFKSILIERPEVSLAVLRSLSRRLREMSA
jgi:hypothetical protein